MAKEKTIEQIEKEKEIIESVLNNPKTLHDRIKNADVPELDEIRLVLEDIGPLNPNNDFWKNHDLDYIFDHPNYMVKGLDFEERADKINDSVYAHIDRIEEQEEKQQNKEIYENRLRIEEISKTIESRSNSNKLSDNERSEYVREIEDANNINDTLMQIATFTAAQNLGIHDKGSQKENPFKDEVLNHAYSSQQNHTDNKKEQEKEQVATAVADHEPEKITPKQQETTPSVMETLMQTQLAERMAFDLKDADEATDKLSKEHPESLVIKSLSQGHGWGVAAEIAKEEGHTDVANILASTETRWIDLLERQRSELEAAGVTQSWSRDGLSPASAKQNETQDAQQAASILRANLEKIEQEKEKERIRATTAAAENTGKEQESTVQVNPSGKELDRGEFIVPLRITQAYSEVEGKFYAKDSNRMMFQDKGEKIATSTTDKKAIADMVEYAKAKQWESLKLTGSKEFRREAWLQAESQGMKTSGYTPKAEDLAALKTLTAERATNTIAPLQERHVERPREPQKEAPRHDLNKNQAALAALAEKNKTQHLAELKDKPGFENHTQEELTKIAFYRAVLVERESSAPGNIRDEALARFDVVMQDKNKVSALPNVEAKIEQQEKPKEVAQEAQQKAYEEQSL